MTSPLKFDVGELLNAQGADALPEQRTQTGPAPERIGVEMIAIPKGEGLTCLLYTSDAADEVRRV